MTARVNGAAEADGFSLRRKPVSPSEFSRRSVAVIFAALVASTLAGLIVANTAITIFIGVIAGDYGWSHAEIGAAVTALFIGVGVGAPLFGPVVDRVGARRVVLPLAITSGLLLSSLSLIGPSLPLFYAVHFLLGMATPGAVAYSKLISTWFFRRRGIALTALGAGSLLGSVIVPPLARLLLERFGWRSAYLGFGMGELFIAFPVLLLFFRERPVSRTDEGTISNEVHPDGAPPIGILNAVRSKSYWLVLGTQITGMFVYFGFGTHAVGIMSERGIDAATATFGVSVVALGGVLAQMATGLLLDRFDTPRVIVPFAASSALGLGLLFSSRGTVPVIASVFLYGVGIGGQISMTSYFITRYFGVRNFSKIYGSLMPVLLLFSAPAPIVIGALFDASRSYISALAVLEACLLVSIVLFALLKAYPYPVPPARRATASKASVCPPEAEPDKSVFSQPARDDGCVHQQ